jgi:N-methylhydantoinase B
MIGEEKKVSNVAIDPVTLEVLRHRLWMINDEQGRVAAQLSGSPVVYEAKDFNTALLTPEGDSLFIGIYMTRLSLCLNHVVKTVISRFSNNVGYADGDVFVTNDPWAGAAHMNDFVMVAPIYYGDALVCWTGLAMHEVDVGGPNPGSFTVGTADVFGEGPLIPPVKMVERGQIRDDIEAMVVRNSRTPHLNGLNMRARIAAINRTRQRIREVIDEYGLPTFMQAQRGILDLVSASFGRRLRSLQDGNWISEAFLDHDGNQNRLYRLRLKITKRDNRLKFDFTGTDRQARGAINCTRVGLESGVLSAVLPMLCYDMPWSPGGIMPLIEIVSEEGTINNAQHPAAVSMATVSAIFATSHVTSGTIAKMLACSDLQEEVQANWVAAWQGTTLAGHFDDGRSFTAVLLDQTGGSGGRSWRDGVDSAGLPGTPAMAIANVETYENEYPILYVYRRQSPDTGGPGFYRGGVGTEAMIIPHRNQGPIDMTVIGHGVSQPEAQGLYGGHPSSVQVRLLLRGADIRRQFAAGSIPTTFEAVDAQTVETLAAKHRTLVFPDDAVLAVSAGGGGYGDALERDPEKVLRDVALGLVGEKVANEIYGVIFNDASGSLAVDPAATEIARNAVRSRRLAESKLVSTENTALHGLHSDKAATGRRIGMALKMVNSDRTMHYACQACGHPLAREGEDPKTGMKAREESILSLSPWNRYGLIDEVVVREFCCPSCAHMLAVEVRKKGDPVLYDTDVTPNHGAHGGNAWKISPSNS